MFVNVAIFVKKKKKEDNKFKYNCSIFLFIRYSPFDLSTNINPIYNKFFWINVYEESNFVNMLRN